jgi:hypothetical protein
VLESCNNNSEEYTGAEDSNYCDAISDYATPQDCADFQTQAERTLSGQAAFNTPGKMARGDQFQVSLAIAANPPPTPSPTSTPAPTPTPSPSAQPTTTASDTATAQAPAPDAAAGLEPQALAPRPEEVVAALPGKTQTFDLTVGEHVSAELSGDDGFKIEPRSDKTQIVKLAKPFPATLWTWNVTAVHGGTHVLTIRTVVEAKDRQGRYHELTHSIKSYSFPVKVTWIGWLQDVLQQAPIWMKLLAGALVAFAALIAAVKEARDKLFDLLGIRRRQHDPPPAP